MHIIRPNCRVQFTAADLEFVLSILTRDHPEDRNALTRLMSDESMRNDLLDHELLFHVLLEANGCLRVSSRFYFYVLVRHALKEVDVEDREVADYIAELLAEFCRAERVNCRIPGRSRPAEYVFEMLEAQLHAEDRTRFFIQAHVGNHTLFLSGVFLNRIRERTRRRGAPALNYYEGMGITNFKLARDHRLAREYHLQDVYDVLFRRFRDARRALNDLAERLVFIDSPAPIPDLLS